MKKEIHEFLLPRNGRMIPVRSITTRDEQGKIVDNSMYEIDQLSPEFAQDYQTQEPA
jgi:hypothetical protein